MSTATVHPFQEEQQVLPPVLQPLQRFVQPGSIIVRSPGRINLIGEHTDYNQGFVMPAAIDKAAYLIVKRREDQQVHLYSHDFNETYTTSIDALQRSAASSWPNYILGVVDELLKKSYTLHGFDLAFTADVPIGAGLSSSAALECATVFALNKVFNLGLESLAMVQLAQKAENNFVGVQCGIMDQFASMFGKKGQVIQLDCRSLEYAYFPFDAPDIKIVLLDTQVKHSLASSEYNTRRTECETGVAVIKAQYPQVESLRDVTPAMVEALLRNREDKVYQRCKYVVEENRRLLAAAEDLQQNNLVSFGQRMYETHEGLSKLYEVSCPELDFLVEAARKEPGILGARMMGGGFGGCVIALIKEQHIDEVVARISAAYRDSLQQELKTYITTIENGTAQL